MIDALRHKVGTPRLLHKMETPQIICIFNHQFSEVRCPLDFSSFLWTPDFCSPMNCGIDSNWNALEYYTPMVLPKRWHFPSAHTVCTPVFFLQLCRGRLSGRDVYAYSTWYAAIYHPIYLCYSPTTLWIPPPLSTAEHWKDDDRKKWPPKDFFWGDEWYLEARPLEQLILPLVELEGILSWWIHDLCTFPPSIQTLNRKFTTNIALKEGQGSMHRNLGQC